MKYVLVFLLLLAGCEKQSETTSEPHHVRHHVHGAYRDCDSCSQTAKDLAWSLDYESATWSNSGFSVCQEWSHACIWYSNGIDGLSAGTGMLGGGWKPEGKDRTMLWGAVQDWLKNDLDK